MPNLEIINVFYLSQKPILYALTSTDYKMLVFSDINKLKFLSMKLKAVALIYPEEVKLGRFNEKLKFFVFITDSMNIFIFRNYSKLIKIVELVFGFQLFLNCDDEKLVIRHHNGSFSLINTDLQKIERSIDKVRKLDKSLKYRKNVFLVSCLSFFPFINYT